MLLSMRSYSKWYYIQSGVIEIQRQAVGLWICIQYRWFTRCYEPSKVWVLHSKKNPIFSVLSPAIFLNILNLVNHRTLYWSLIPSLFSYVSNIIGLIRDCFLLTLRFDLFWDKIDKKYANLEEPDPYLLSVLHFK